MARILNNTIKGRARSAPLYKKPMSANRRLSAAQFDATLKFVRLSEPRKVAAYRVMVDGESQITVAEENGWTRNNVSNLVKRVWDEATKLNLVQGETPVDTKPGRRLTQAQFDEVCQHITMNEDRIAAARQVLVLGQPAVSVAEDRGWSRNNVFTIVTKVWGTALDLGVVVAGESVVPDQADILPDGWAKRTFVAPAALLDRWAGELATLNTSVPAKKTKTAASKGKTAR